MAFSAGTPPAPRRVVKCQGCRYTFSPVAAGCACPRCGSRQLLPAVTDLHLLPLQRVDRRTVTG